MEKDFIPYQEALALKELGFDDIRFAHWTHRREFIIGIAEIKVSKLNVTEGDFCVAPLYSQAFRWFRDVHNIHLLPVEMYPYIWSIDGYSESYNSYEEAEAQCLKRLIEIAKKKK